MDLTPKEQEELHEWLDQFFWPPLADDYERFASPYEQKPLDEEANCT